MALRLKRRDLLKAGAVGGAAAALAGTRPSPAGAAGAPTPGRHAPPGRLVAVFLRGGQDHLSATVPYTDADYYDRRPRIAVPDGAVLDLDGRFGFHPAMTGLHSLYRDRRLSLAVATGNPAGDRSHFFAQDLVEHGDVSIPDDGLGWLGRHLGRTETDDASPFRGLTLGNHVTASLRGHPALGIAAIRSFGLGGASGATAGLGSTYRAGYGHDRLVDMFGRQALDAAEQIATLDVASDPDPIARGFADTAILLEADIGIEAVTVDMGGWDTHAQQGTHDRGEMADLLGTMDAALSDFQADLDRRGLVDVTTVVMTEFGRRVLENGAGGSDHGWGSAMLVMGGAATGGVHGEWRGLSDDATGERGDVPVTTDGRDVLGDLVVDVLGGDPSEVFPGHSWKRVGVTV